ncbi:MAG: DUF1059 domain-containing protein [Elusimicrobia bacterium]|nr:DUF1059 domain-containing protein [Elusimicrobiota bacterium]
MTESKRVVLDCRKHPNSKCSVTIAGTEAEVLEIGEYHAASKHGYAKGPELRKELQSFLKEESLVR